jgi:acyl-coenzyme A synthetase/AMP-(fatty) acid ligase
MTTVLELIDSIQPDRHAIGTLRDDTGTGKPALSYRVLAGKMIETVACLNSIGIGRGDRVAIVLPNGPEMAVAFHAVAAGASSAALNPAYREDEFDFYISDLGAKALMVMEGIDALVTAVSEVADLAGIDTPVLKTILGLIRRRAFEAGCYTSIEDKSQPEERFT